MLLFMPRIDHQQRDQSWLSERASEQTSESERERERERERDGDTDRVRFVKEDGERASEDGVLSEQFRVDERSTVLDTKLSAAYFPPRWPGVGRTNQGVTLRDQARANSRIASSPGVLKRWQRPG